MTVVAVEPSVAPIDFDILIEHSRRIVEDTFASIEARFAVHPDIPKEPVRRAPARRPSTAPTEVVKDIEVRHVAAASAKRIEKKNNRMDRFHKWAKRSLVGLISMEAGAIAFLQFGW